MDTSLVPFLLVLVLAFTNRVDHVADGGWTVLRELTRDFHPVLSPSCLVEGPERASRSALIVIARVFIWPLDRLRHVRGGVGRSSPFS